MLSPVPVSRRLQLDNVEKQILDNGGDEEETWPQSSQMSVVFECLSQNPDDDSAERTTALQHFGEGGESEQQEEILEKAVEVEDGLEGAQTTGDAGEEVCS